MNIQSEKISLAMNQNSARIIKICKKSSNNPTFGFIGNQVCRSSTSAGANYEEACGAESKADFIHKLHITYKDLRETMYWLRLMKSTDLADQEELSEIINSTNELLKIIGKSLITSKKNSGRL